MSDLTESYIAHLQQYVQYIKNTAQVPLKVEHFDDDWDPIGPKLRADMIGANLIIISEDGIRLVEV